MAARAPESASEFAPEFKPGFKPEFKMAPPPPGGIGPPPSGIGPLPVAGRFFEFSLLGMLAAGYFAVVGSGYLDWPTAALTLLGLCLRGLMVAA